MLDCFQIILIIPKLFQNNSRVVLLYLLLEFPKIFPQAYNYIRTLAETST